MILKSPPSKTVIVEIDLPDDTGEVYNELIAQLDRLDFTYTITPEIFWNEEESDDIKPGIV